MPKSKTPAQAAEACATDMQLLVRMKSADDNGYCRCVTCGKIKHYKDGMQGGHFIERGKSATKLIEENVHPQCSHCNGFRMKGSLAVLEYNNYMIDMYTKEFVDELIEKSRKPQKWVRSEIQELHADIKKQIKFHKQRLGEV